jgi:MoaA/NifB/PqqE/SkfB family radical SAM enzyme
MLIECKKKYSKEATLGEPWPEERNLSKEPTPSLPVTVALQLAESCNLRCAMCYYWGETGVYSGAETRERPGVLELDQVRRFVEEMKPQRPIYSLFGGEPPMHPQIEDVIVAIKEAGSYVDTPTNGTLLREDAAMLVKTGFNSVCLSLDSPREINDRQRRKGGFDKAPAGIDALHQEKQRAGGKGPSLEIICTVTEETAIPSSSSSSRNFPSLQSTG